MSFRRAGTAVITTAALFAGAACSGAGTNPEKAKGPECVNTIIEGQASSKPKTTKQLLGEIAMVEARITSAGIAGCFITRLFAGECLLTGPSRGTGVYSTAEDPAIISIEANDGTKRSINEHITYNSNRKSIVFGPPSIVNLDPNTGQFTSSLLPGAIQESEIPGEVTVIVPGALVLWGGKGFIEASQQHPVMSVTSEENGSATNFVGYEKALNDSHTCVLPNQAAPNA